MTIVGQDLVLRYLSHGLEINRLSPSLLFVGPEGVGKKTTALGLAKFFQCARTRNSGLASPSLCCDQCPACSRVNAQNHTDVLLINRPFQAALLREKPESQTAIKIEAIRHLDKFLRLRAMEGRRRVAIIDEAERMTHEAANALLKVLEEPPTNTQIVLIAVDLHSLLPTIVSRCSVLTFKPVPTPILVEWLERTQGIAHEEAEKLADHSGGSFAKALAHKERGDTSFDLSAYACDEFFELLSQTQWHKEGRKKAEQLINQLIASAQKKLNAGDVSALNRLQSLLWARKQIDRNVPARLVLESLYVSLEPPFAGQAK